MKEKNRALKRQVKQLAKKAGVAVPGSDSPEQSYASSNAPAKTSKTLYKLADVMNESTSNSHLRSSSAASDSASSQNEGDTSLANKVDDDYIK